MDPFVQSPDLGEQVLFVIAIVVGNAPTVKLLDQNLLLELVEIVGVDAAKRRAAALSCGVLGACTARHGVGHWFGFAGKSALALSLVKSFHSVPSTCVFPPVLGGFGHQTVTIVRTMGLFRFLPFALNKEAVAHCAWLGT